MTATEFYGGGGNLTGVGVDGIVSTADATAITITSAEHVGVGITSPGIIAGGTRYLTTGTQSANAAGFFELVGNRTVNAGQDVAIIKFINNTTQIAEIGAYDNGSTNGGDLKFFTSSGGTTNERLRILSSGGITFNGDTATANALDDYEEGTWTPRVFKSTTEITSPNTATGTYRKVGSLIFLACYFAKNSGTNTASGAYNIQGMPYSLGVSSPFAYQSGSIGYWKFNGTWPNPPGSGQQNLRAQSNASGLLSLYGTDTQTNWTSGDFAISMFGCFCIA
jgi:hypothetical protein